MNVKIHRLPLTFERKQYNMINQITLDLSMFQYIHLGDVLCENSPVEFFTNVRLLFPESINIVQLIY